MAKIISISVFGSNPRYCAGALKNAQIAQILFPDWIVRIFVDSTVPSNYIEELLRFPNVELLHFTDQRVFGMFWRFYSMFMQDQDSVISRDSDSRLSIRELKCINQWIASNKKFSIIRDHPTHYHLPLLGGMWGMKGMMDEKAFREMNKYSNCHIYGSDQTFLREIVWDYAEHNCMIHGFLEIDWMKSLEKQVASSDRDTTKMTSHSTKMRGVAVRRIDITSFLFMYLPEIVSNARVISRQV